jgi:hypothetical protein
MNELLQRALKQVPNELLLDSFYFDTITEYFDKVQAASEINTFTDFIFYKNYICQFDTRKVNTPQQLDEVLLNEPTWPTLLMQFANGYIINTGILMPCMGLEHNLNFSIQVYAFNTTTTKNLQDLTSNEIITLLALYMHEQMCLELRSLKSEYDCISVKVDRNKKLSAWQGQLMRLDTDAILDGV